MKVEFLNPFVEAIVEVLKAEVGTTVNRQDITVQKTALTTDDITVLIHLVGQIDGVVLYGMPTSTGLKLISVIMGQEFKEMDNLAQSGIAELSNVITGRATMKYSQAGYCTDISTPMVIAGKGIQISTLDFPRVLVPLETAQGPMTVHLALRESPRGQNHKPDEFVPLLVKPANR
jgi:chemotaxis protein CheX